MPWRKARRTSRPRARSSSRSSALPSACSRAGGPPGSAWLHRTSARPYAVAVGISLPWCAHATRLLTVCVRTRPFACPALELPRAGGRDRAPELIGERDRDHAFLERHLHLGIAEQHQPRNLGAGLDHGEL